MDISIILPTFNEKESITTTIKKIQKSIQNKKISYEIIVVDDDSPDMTWKIVEDISKKDNRIKILRRKNKKGLSSAVIDGFQKAKGKFLFVLDADGQHDEKQIPKIFDKLNKEKADIVVASRFTKRGSVEGWSKFRIFQSRVAAFLSIPVLGKKTTDPMSGFFGIKKEIFQKVKSKLTGKGYKILLDMLFNTKKEKILEVPYKFKMRKKGKSKLGIKVIFEYLWMLLIYFIRKYSLFLKFCVVGLIGVFVNMVILTILTEFFNIYYLISSIIAIETSIITNFLLNNFWTWKKRSKKHSFLSRMLKYNLVAFGGLILNWSALFLFTEKIGIFYVVSNLIGILIATLWNFILNNVWTFKGIKE